MKAFLSTVCAATMMFGAAIPLQAAPMVPQVTSPAPAEVIHVQNRSTMEFGDRGWRGKRWHRGGRHWDRRDWRRHRHWRHRDRDWDDNDVAVGLGAFAAGALLGGALNSGPRVVHRGNAHVEWCYDRYRSYRASDNTFQPYHGPRKQCYSPYS